MTHAPHTSSNLAESQEKGMRESQQEEIATQTDAEMDNKEAENQKSLSLCEKEIDFRSQSFG